MIKAANDSWHSLYIIHFLFFPLQNLAMFLSMLVAWMFPDVPRSLREQLKKENMVLMEYLLNHDQEACAKSQSSKPSIHCVPTNVEIVVEAPSEEDDQPVVDEEEVGVEISVDESTQMGDGGPEVQNPSEDTEETQQGEDVDEGAEGREEERDGEINEEDGKKDGEQESGDVKEEGRRIDEERNDVKEEPINFSVDIDVIMSELGLLGKRKI